MVIRSFKRFTILTTVVVGLVVPESVVRADFEYTDFSSVSGLSFQGFAQQAGNVLRVMPELPGGTGRAGSVWYQASKQQVNLGFVTEFQYRVWDTDGTHADGFAFVIQNATSIALGGIGAGIGYDGIIITPATVVLTL